MDFFEAVSRRRSIRKFGSDLVPDSVIERALEAAIWAPNSSNIQTWDFFWSRNLPESERHRQLVQACLTQAAARTAQHLIVVTANPRLWRRSQPELLKWAEREKAPRMVQDYYGRLVPLVYRNGFLGSFGVLKWLLTSVRGLWRPVERRPHLGRDLQEVAVKSAALAAENFVLAVSAQGFDTCMMEGMDELRVRRILALPRAYRVVMVIAVGKSSDRGTWGKPFRLPIEQVVHRV